MTVYFLMSTQVAAEFAHPLSTTQSGEASPVMSWLQSLLKNSNFRSGYYFDDDSMFFSVYPFPVPHLLRLGRNGN
jgi:hypothetical protein